MSTKGKIIIVEDDPEQLETLSEYLTLKGYEVRGTECALDFFQALLNRPYDVAIVDIGLPDRTGFEVVEHLRSKTSLGVIVLTARDSMGDKMRGYEAGADHYFTKPLDSRELAAAVGNLIARLSAGRGEPAAPGVWLLAPLRRTLTSPAGEVINLSEKETTFLRLAISENGAPVSRNTLLEALDYQSNEEFGGRALAVMITRLRKKIRDQTGLKAPIKAVRLRGYGFSAPADIA